MFPPNFVCHNELVRVLNEDDHGIRYAYQIKKWPVFACVRNVPLAPHARPGPASEHSSRGKRGGEDGMRGGQPQGNPLVIKTLYVHISYSISTLLE